MSESGDDSRELGIEFGDLEDDLEGEDYPVSADELLDRYGDREVGMSDGTQSFREVLVTGGDEEFESADEVKQTVLNRVGGEAVGRQGYSDRGTGSAEGEESDESF
ncbi:hypothetical protein NGM10_07345 [Halorussus salilacus]|uniref:DUF5789 family protein n=1 Tax=Halorussus salilacus TaxID=2953750 RepID=UPI00209D90D2|nr:hypothetical protein [Halorussus salilacus]USZ69539.1 hypothetical protein NGM10_07345 [Halorussus salilacus]